LGGKRKSSFFKEKRSLLLLPRTRPRKKAGPAANLSGGGGDIFLREENHRKERVNSRGASPGVTILGKKGSSQKRSYIEGRKTLSAETRMPLEGEKKRKDRTFLRKKGNFVLEGESSY